MELGKFLKYLEFCTWLKFTLLYPKFYWHGNFCLIWVHSEIPQLNYLPHPPGRRTSPLGTTALVGMFSLILKHSKANQNNSIIQVLISVL